jgi:hypothetical protein
MACCAWTARPRPALAVGNGGRLEQLIGVGYLSSLRRVTRNDYSTKLLTSGRGP